MPINTKNTNSSLSPAQVLDSESVRNSVFKHLHYTLGKDVYAATLRDWFNTIAYTVRERLTESWLRTHRAYHNKDSKRVYYISMEFLIGKTLQNGMVNAGIEEVISEVTKSFGLDLNEIMEAEDEAGLGNGGLGRLAACFLDSMSSMSIPGYGYGIRFEYGMFRQEIRNFQQVEHPDNWLRYGNPWEFPRPEFLYTVKYNGRVHEFTDESGRLQHEWVDCDEVMAMAYDIPIPGYKCHTVNNLRLWSAKSSRDFELSYFNHGDYIKAVEQKTNAEKISKILYPKDDTQPGKSLRLKQEYFLVSATLQDIFRRYKNAHPTCDEFPEKIAIQLNDTHPALAIAELMRLLVDAEELDWDKAWDITRKTINYTNHTVMSEALESWPVFLMEQILPRHTQIIYEINRRFLNDVFHHYPGDTDRLRRMSIIEEGPEKRVRMANLAIVGSGMVNGVSAIHTEILKKSIFRDFNDLYPERFTNMTNGISQRFWLQKSNKPLSALITGHIGEEWLMDLYELKKLVPFSGDPAFRDKWRQVKRANKKVLADLIFMTLGVSVNPDSLFDVQVKRVHEYKRQLLNILHVITLYNRLKAGRKDNFVPRTVIFSGKAAPGYRAAKDVISLINCVADIVNNDPAIGDLLKVVFLPNYGVSLAEKIIPAADLSEQISVAGTEASGTGCMKLSLNGALTICTLDGANVEIRDEVGSENIFVFGMNAKEAAELGRKGYDPGRCYNSDPELRNTLDSISGGLFSLNRPDNFHDLIGGLLGSDPYMVLADYADYVRRQEEVSSLYRDKDEWARKSILNVARIGKFSSDRTIKEYSEKIWGVKPVK